MPDKHNIHPQLLPMAVDIAGLTPDPRNARAHDERNVAAVAESYQAHGQRKPIVVQLKADNGTPMVIRAGNGQTEAAKRLGWTRIAAIVIDERDKEAIAFALRDNRTSDLAEWDLAALGDNLRYLESQQVDLTSVGWESYEVEPLLAAEWKPPADTGEEFNVPPKKEHIVFTADQWSDLKSLLCETKPKAETILRLLRAGRVAEQETLS